MVAGLEFDVSDEQVVNQCGPDLDQDGILGGSQEGFYFKVLLDPFEEQFDIPAGLVDLGDGGGRQLEVIGHKGKSFIGDLVKKGDQTQAVGIFSKTLRTTEQNDLIGKDCFFYRLVYAVR